MRTALTLIFALLASAWPGAQESVRLQVRLFAHRGFTRDLPENSMAALQAAAALGISGAEIDLRTTRDGHVVLMHDATIERTTNGTGQVDGLTFEALSKLRLEGLDGRATPEGVPDLDAVLRFLAARPRFEVAFDAKAVDVAVVGKRISSAGLQDRVWFFLDDPLDVARAQAVKRVDPRLHLSVNLMAWWKVEGLPTFVKQSLGADALFAHEFYFPRFGGSFDEARRAGAEVQVYLPGADNLPNRLREAARIGATVVSTDRPDLLVALVVPASTN